MIQNQTILPTSPEGTLTGSPGDTVTSSDGRNWVKSSGDATTTGWTETGKTTYKRTREVRLAPIVGNTALTLTGMAAMSSNGSSASARTLATTSTLTKHPRIGYSSTAVAGTLCGTRQTFSMFLTGTYFKFGFKFGVSDATMVTAARMFIGMQASTAIPTVATVPTAILNGIGVGHVENATTLSVITNDGAGTATSQDTGFTLNNTEMYECVFEQRAGATSVFYSIRRMSDDAVYVGTSTDIPASNTALTINCFRSNNTAALTASFDLGDFWLETVA